MPDKSDSEREMYENLIQKIYAPYVYEPQIDLHCLEEKIDALNRKLDLIFGDHVLINGRFVSIKKFAEGVKYEKTSKANH